MATTEFDDTRARTYRKETEVLAFRSADTFWFAKSWGRQEVRANGWVIVPLAATGEASTDVYGCDDAVFAATYVPSPSLRPNQYRKKETVRAYQPGVPFTIRTTLGDGHVETAESTPSSHTTWLVKNIGGELYTIADDKFQQSYVEVLQRTGPYAQRDRDGHWIPDGAPRRILALDGGGVRGMLTLQYLAKIETLLAARHDPGGAGGFRLSHYFDLIAGTSTGAIIAACLAKGMRVAQIVTLYEKLAGDVFERSWFRLGILRAKFGARRLRRHLDEIFRDNTMGSAALDTGLLVVAKRLDTGSVWPMSNNPRNPYFTARPGDTFFSNEDYLLRKVVRASTAAPHFFAPEYIEISSEGDRPRGEFIDGGASPHNNPALLALQLVAVSGFGANWPLDPDKLLLVSVGTGAADPGVSRSWFAGQHAFKSLVSLMDDCAESVETMLQWLSDSPTARRIDGVLGDLRGNLLAGRPLLQYLRYNVQLERDWLDRELGLELEEARLRQLRKMDQPASIGELKRIGQQAAEKQILPAHFPAQFDLT